MAGIPYFINMDKCNPEQSIAQRSTTIKPMNFIEEQQKIINDLEQKLKACDAKMYNLNRSVKKGITSITSDISGITDTIQKLLDMIGSKEETEFDLPDYSDKEKYPTQQLPSQAICDNCKGKPHNLDRVSTGTSYVNICSQCNLEQKMDDLTKPTQEEINQMREELEYSELRSVKCPHCGEDQNDAWELGIEEEGEHEIECERSNCRKAFIVETVIEYSFTMKKPDW